MSQRSVNRSKYWMCPFFKWDGVAEVSCEGGRPSFPDKDTANDYMDQYCAGDWEKCTLSRQLMKFYEEQDAENDM